MLPERQPRQTYFITEQVVRGEKSLFGPGAARCRNGLPQTFRFAAHPERQTREHIKVLEERIQETEAKKNVYS